nr:transposase (putative), gypsy type [Tanacetum cinerariifolium]
RDAIQLETAISTISQEYLLEFTSEYGILEDLHPEFPAPEESIVDFLEGKVGVYTKFCVAKVSHIEINCHILNIIPTLKLFCVLYVPSFHSGWMSFSKRPGKNTPQYYTKPLDSLKNWNNRFFWVDERVFPIAVDWRTNALKDEMPAANTYSRADVAVLNTRQTPIQKQPETLLCLVGLSRRYFLGDSVYPIFLHDEDRDMDLFNLISAPNLSKVKTGLRPHVAHEVSLFTATVSWVIDMEDPNVETGSYGTPSAIEKSRCTLIMKIHLHQ